MKKSIELRLNSDPELLRVLRATAAQISHLAGFSSLDVGKIVLAVDEACSNVMRHAYGGALNKPIIITFIIEKSKLVIQILDYGKSFDLKKVKPRDLDEIKPGGLGLHLINSVMDDVQFKSNGAQGNVMIMTKHIEKE